MKNDKDMLLLLNITQKQLIFL